MCGIVGIFSQSGDLFPIDAMTSALGHRGPDAGAVWLDAEGGIALGHRRLSIVDLSKAGAQPMHSPSGRFILVFNGEIYNHLELRIKYELTDVPAMGEKETKEMEKELGK